MIMSILFHIFVVLITNIMFSKENINVPKVSESPIHGVGYKPLTGGTFNFSDMKMIQDLKQQFPKPSSKQKRHLAIYECPICKKHFRTWVESIKRGSTQSCGCNRKGVNSTHKQSGTRLYRIWAGMKMRCNYSNCISYVRYGARGITICEEWNNDFTTFYVWSMQNGYEGHLEIDRKNNDEGYSPFNCRWVTKSVNCQNTRRLRSTNTSGKRGVNYLVKRNKWIARICDKRHSYNLGYFKTEIEAINAYNNFIKKNKTLHPLNIINN